uniref:Nicotinate-nucleotide--dimethylbenzimidazole phosphoribosyltransferase n=1 Tax=OCS116 cluster bacterium TaxID=2030921 RepID=A0A2A4YRZ6_9PROT
MSFSVAAQPFEDLRKLLASIADINSYQDEQDVISWLQSVANGTDDKTIETHRSLITLFASSNGIDEDVANSATKQQLRQLMDDSAAGKGRLNKMCEVYGHGLRIFDLALDMPTKKSYLEPTLDEKNAAATVAFGMEAIAGGADMLAVGALATAAEQVAASVVLAIMPEAAQIIEAEMAEDFALINRIATSCQPKKPLEILGAIGGREIAAIIGAIISARTAHVSVILDDLPSLVAALILHRENAKLTSHCRLAICQSDLMALLLQKMNMQSVFVADAPKLNGANAALAMGILKGSVAAQ